MNSAFKGSVKTRRFSLIELLVTVAIIAILAGLLLPALSKVRSKGKAVSCMNNIKQLVTAFNIYCGDYGDFLPSRSNSSWNETFFNRLAGIPNETSSKMANTGSQGTYLSIKVFYCPEMPVQNLTGDGADYDWWARYTHYGVNDMLYHGLPVNAAGIPESRRITAIRNPSRKYLFADTFINTSSGVPDLQKGHWRLVNSPGSKTDTGYAAFAGRHGGLFNAARVDGSIFSHRVYNIYDPYSQVELQCHVNLQEFYWNK